MPISLSNPSPRIIPACAGSTHNPRRSSGANRDHPRMRGEHTRTPAPLVCNLGSSPHARGARRSEGRSDGLRGIIPACAGSTKTSWCSTTALRDHPRMRGEHHFSRQAVRLLPGSSPHARGAQQIDCSKYEAMRIIPACAGSTVGLAAIVDCLQDHPRMRGEHTRRPSQPLRS